MFTVKKYLIRYVGNPDLESVWELEYFGETVQVIVCRLPTLEILKKFSLNLSMIWWSGIFYKTNAYSIGRDYKAVIKINPDIYPNDYYIGKIIMRFPDYQYYESAQAFISAGYDNDITD